VLFTTFGQDRLRQVEVALVIDLYCFAELSLKPAPIDSEECVGIIRSGQASQHRRAAHRQDGAVVQQKRRKVLPPMDASRLQ
jgi:hypothetical protein